jgi:hypothetical protein
MIIEVEKTTPFCNRKECNMTKKKGSMSKRLRKQKAHNIFEQERKEELINMSDKELRDHINYLKHHQKQDSKTYSGNPYVKKEIEDATEEMESRKKK